MKSCLVSAVVTTASSETVVGGTSGVVALAITRFVAVALRSCSVMPVEDGYIGVTRSGVRGKSTSDGTVGRRKKKRTALAAKVSAVAKRYRKAFR